MRAVPIFIRDATSDDADAVDALYRRSSLHWETRREEILAADAFDAPADDIRAGRVRVAIDGNVIVGFTTLIPGDAATSELDALFVDPPAMGRGIGRLLVDDAVRRARDARVSRIKVIANENALEFYQRMGFVVAGTAGTRFGPAPVMYRAVST